MPTNFHNPRLGARERYFARQSTYRTAQAIKHVEVLQAPWMGWVPDLPPHLVGWRGYREGKGLVPFAWESRGLFLRHDDGYDRVDPTNLPLGEVAVGPPSSAAGQFAVTMLGQYFDATPAPNRIAVVAGDTSPVPADVPCAVYRMNPGTGAWANVAFTGLWAGANEPTGNRDAIWDHCVFPFGTARRNATANPIVGPVMIFCNQDADGPVDRVCVTPDDNGALFYDELHGNALAPGAAFRAASCESFNGRVHFLNTSEGAGTLHPQRHRWTAVGDADPDEVLVGSGYLDLAEFQRGGLRIESMQDKLVLYYGDGVAFQVPTGFYADAFRPQIVSQSRGLLAGQALCAISPHLHFGIFNDGWWTLDSSGRWSKLGRIILEESSGKSHELTKWEDSFYEDLDFQQKHRIVCVYDRYREVIRIAYPSRYETGSENYRILNYHPLTDSCWKDRYTTPTTAFGVFDIQETVGLTWDADTPGTWDQDVGSWDQLGPQYIEEVVVHGNGPTVQSEWDAVGVDWYAGYTVDGGLVFARDATLSTYDGVPAPYIYWTHALNKNPVPLQRQTFHRLGVEYVRISDRTLGVVVDTDELGDFQGGNISLSEGTIGTMQNGYVHFRLDGGDHRFLLYGDSPVAIRSIVAELFLYGGADREGKP